MMPPAVDGGESPEPPDEHPPPGSLPIAVTSNSRAGASPLLRIITVALIGVTGLAFFLTRATLAPILDRAVPVLARGIDPEPVAEPEAAPPEATAEEIEEEPSGPQLTYEEIETMLIPLPERLLALIGEGRGELPEYRELSSSDDFQARKFRNRWQSWGMIWGNRVKLIEDDMPPAEECRIHASLKPTCMMLEEAARILRTVPSAERIDEAQDHLDRAAAVIEDFLRAAEEAAAAEAAELAEDSAEEAQE